MNLLDADVCIDLLRGRPEAVAWLDDTAKEIGIAVSPLLNSSGVAMTPAN